MHLDYKTLLIVVVLVRVISAMGLLYVWHINRKYVAARLWAGGSALVAFGTLIIAVRGVVPLEFSIIAGNLAVFIGVLVFGGGIVRASGRDVPWLSGQITVSLAMIGITWFTFFEPSIVGRSTVFLAVAVVVDGYAALAALRSQIGRVGAMLKFVAVLLALEIALVATRLFSTFGFDPAGTLPSNNFQTAFALGIVLVTIMMTLALAFITNLIDIEAREKAEVALKGEIERSKRLTEILDTAFSNMRQGLAMYDGNQRLIVCNDNYMKPYGLTRRQALPGMLLTDVVRLRIANGFYAGSDPEAYIESRTRIAAEMLRISTDQTAKLNDGRFLRVTSHPLKSGGWVMTTEDVTERKRQEAETAYLASHDVLTGLANRAHFQAFVSRTADGLKAGHDRFGVFLLDLDRFKKINDTLGHAAGDTLLKEVATRLQRSVREQDIVARLGGDEFAVVQTSARGAGSSASVEAFREGSVLLAHRILEAFNEPIDVGGTEVFAGTSIGIALAPDDGVEPADLLKKADLALYAAKSAGRNTYRIFDNSMLEAVSAQAAVESDMRAGIDRNEFYLEYQPIIDLSSGKIAAFEALIRWKHPKLGVLSPDYFMRAAEESGLIADLGEWVVQRACNDAATWPNHVCVAVNLSAAQFKRCNPVDVMLFALADSGLSPERMQLEVTESVLLDKNADCFRTLEQLKSLGVSTALDDFGTGYSSLSHLTQFGFSRIKIDRSFVTGASGNSDRMAIISALSGLACALSMDCVAQGVESDEDLKIVRAAGIRYVQGQLFGAPQRATDVGLSDATSEMSGTAA